MTKISLKTTTLLLKTILMYHHLTKILNKVRLILQINRMLIQLIKISLKTTTLLLKTIPMYHHLTKILNKVR